MYVLTSGATFSGGEALAYDLQQLGRATVVGERTRGGAHPRRGFRVQPISRRRSRLLAQSARSPGRTGRAASSHQTSRCQRTSLWRLRTGAH
ncbi:MAG: S41 family peptidase [Geodermatophilaceae bacterium]